MFIGFTLLGLSILIHPFISALSKKAVSPITFFAFMHLPIAVFFGWQCFSADGLDIIQTFPFLMVLSQWGGAMYYLLTLYLFRQGDFQVAYPLTRFAPIFILVGEILFLSQAFSVIGIVGIMLSTLSAVWLGLEIKKFHSQWQTYLLIGGIIILHTAATLATKQLLDHITPVELIGFYGLFLAPIILGIFIWRWSLTKQELKSPLILIAGGVGSVANLYLVLSAFSYLPASVAVSFRNLAVLWGMYLGGSWLAEGHKWPRYLAGLAMVIGAGMLIISQK